jgi:hypothetical protein
VPFSIIALNPSPYHSFANKGLRDCSIDLGAN